MDKIREAYADWWANHFDHKARTSQEFYVPVAGPIIGLSIVALMVMESMGGVAAYYSSLAAGMGTGLTMTLTMRRMRDAGVSWFMLPLAVIPVINFGYAALLGALPSAEQPERPAGRR
jgi:uncharacterized membrane protein YhaH (DUF805 family)